MLGARGREGIKRYRRRKRKIPKKWDPIFPGNKTDNISKSGDIHKPTNRANPWEGDRCRRQTRKPGPRTRHQVGGSEMSRRAGPGQPRSRTATHRTGRRVRGTKGQKSRSRSLARMSASATPTPDYQDDSKFFTKKTRSDSTSAPSPSDTKQTVSWPRASTPVPRHPEPEGDWDRRSHLHATTCDNMNGTHRRRCAAQADQEDLTAPTGYNILPLRWPGRNSEARQPRSKGGSGAQRHKTMTKAKDTPPAPGRRATENPNMEYPKRQVEAEARTKRAIRQKTRLSDVRRSSTDPQSSSEEPERHPRKGDNWTGPPEPKELRE